MNKKDKGLLPASITLEAVFVMPIVILMVFALLYLSFFLHDRCRVQGIVDQALHMASISFKHEADLDTGRVDYDTIGDRGVYYQLQGDRSVLEEKLLTYLGRELSSGLWLSKVNKLQVIVQRQEMRIIVGTETSVSIPFIKELFAAVSYTEIEENSSVHDPSETIRYCEVILDTGSQIKGVSKLKDTIEKALGRKQ